MSDILKITKDTISTIFSTIKSEISNVQSTLTSKISSLSTTVSGLEKYIIAAALQGKEITSYSTAASVPVLRRTNGRIIYLTSTQKFCYYNGTTITAITLSTLLSAVINGSISLISPWSPIAQSYWQKSTPFVDSTDMVSQIWKGETCGDYTKWLIELQTDSEDQTYTAYMTGDTSYVYGKHTMYADGATTPWEIWLPSGLAVKSVTINW